MTSPCQAQDAPECSNHSLSIALPTGTRFNFSNFPIHKTHCLRVGITEPWKCLSWENFRLPESHSSPWSAAGPNSQAPAVLQWHYSGTCPLWQQDNPVHCWELWSLSHTLRTFPNFLEMKMQCRAFLSPRMGENVRETMGHLGAIRWKAYIYKKVPGLHILIQKSPQRWFWV